MTKKELDRVLSEHAKWLEDNSTGCRADLSGANLRGANLRCFGDMRFIRTMQIDTWRIGYTHDTLQIGCQRHPIAAWGEWDTATGQKWIARMDPKAKEWAERNLALILEIIKRNPAEAPGPRPEVQVGAER